MYAPISKTIVGVNGNRQMENGDCMIKKKCRSLTLINYYKIIKSGFTSSTVL